MATEYEYLPSLIAIPYYESLKKDSIQRKDFQRITFENALTFNAIIAMSEYYEHNRPNLTESEKKLSKLDRINNIDLSQISVGTWNMISREFSRVLKTDSKNVFVPTIIDLYHGNKAKDWENIAGSLISIRNKDAHGELISIDKLPAELDKRQEILDKLIDSLNFYKDYQLIVPININIDGGQLVYTCKEFSGTTTNTISIVNPKDELTKFRIYLYNKVKNISLCLNPMLVYHSNKDDVNDFQLFTYSKTSNPKLGNLHYLSLKSSKDFIASDHEINGDLLTSAQICQEFQSFRIIVEDPTLHNQKKPSLNISRSVKNDFVSKDELVEMKLSIKNDGEVAADNLKINFPFPSQNFTICDKEGNILNYKNINDIFDENLSIDSGEKRDFFIYFFSKDSGQYEFPPISIEYEYTDFQGEIISPKIDKDGNTINIESSAALYCTIYDPSDPFSLSPIINVSLSLDFGLDENGKRRKFAYIGETIFFTLNISNEGLGVAKNVDVTLFVPEGAKLIEGNEAWIGNINPLQTISRKYELELINNGIQSINVREISFQNNDNKMLKTSGGTINYLVRNNPKVQFRQLMNKVWADLSLDDEEVEEWSFYSKKYGKMLDDETKMGIETSEKMKVIKDIINQIAKNKNFQLIEKFTKNQMLLYCYNTVDLPILAINYDDPKNIKVFLRADLQNKFPKEIITIRNLLRNIEFNKIGFSDPSESKPQEFPGGSNNLKGLLGRAIGWIEKHDFIQYKLKQVFAKNLGMSSEDITAKFTGNICNYTILDNEGEPNELMQVNSFSSYFDEKNTLHLVVKANFNVTIRKKLAAEGYEFVSKKSDDGIEQYIKVDSASTFMHIGSKKINNLQDEEAFANLLNEFILKALKYQNDELESILKANEVAEEDKIDILNLHSLILTKFADVKEMHNFKGIIFNIDSESKNKNTNFNITYYAIKDFPLYQTNQIVLRISISKKKKGILFRFLDDDLIANYQDQIELEKSEFPYTIINMKNEEVIQLAITNAFDNLDEFVKPNYYLFKTIFEKQWIGGLAEVLTGYFELIDTQQETDKNNLQSYFDANDIKISLNRAIGATKSTFRANNWENPFEENSGNIIIVKNHYYEQIKNAVNNYEVIVDDRTKALHNYKYLVMEILAQKRDEIYGLRKMETKLAVNISDEHRVFCYWAMANYKNKNEEGIVIRPGFARNTDASEYMYEQILELQKSNEPVMVNNHQLIFDEKAMNNSAYREGRARIFIPIENAEDYYKLETAVNVFTTHNELVKLLIPEEHWEKILVRIPTQEDIDKILNK